LSVNVFSLVTKLPLRNRMTFFRRFIVDLLRLVFDMVFRSVGVSVWRVCRHWLWVIITRSNFWYALLIGRQA